VTGHPVSHDTALPDRLAPYTSAYRSPLRSSSRPNPARRRRISETENENPGCPPADTLRCWTRTRPARNQSRSPRAPMSPRETPGIADERARHRRTAGRCRATQQRGNWFHHEVRDRPRRRGPPGSRGGCDPRRTSAPGSGASALAGAVTPLSSSPRRRV